MAENYTFFDSVDGDREYQASTFAEYFKQFLRTGVYHQNNLPGLKLRKGTLLESILETGAAFVNGYMYQNTEEITFTHDQADATNPRIDRVVIRLDTSIESRFIKAFVLKGTPATTPVPPALTRNENIFEISMAQVRVNAGSGVLTSVTDERFDQALCGLVNSLITSPFVFEGSQEPVTPNFRDIWFDTSV